MRSELTEDEVDAVMENIHPSARRWCSISCGPRPDENMEMLKGFACACSGCIGGDLSWEEFSAWEKREAERDPTPYRQIPSPRQLTLAERLESFKASKRAKGDIPKFPTTGEPPHFDLPTFKAPEL